MPADDFITAFILFVAVIGGGIFSVWICYVALKAICVAIARAIRDDREGK